MKIQSRISLNTLIFSLVMGFVVGVTVGKMTETKITYYTSDYQNYDDFSDFDEFSGFDEFNDTYQSDSVVDIQTEFNYPYALLSGSLVFGAILVLNVIVKKEQ